MTAAFGEWRDPESAPRSDKPHTMGPRFLAHDGREVVIARWCHAWTSGKFVAEGCRGHFLFEGWMPLPEVER